ncbi:peptidase M24, structural domain-containing protein [Zychaea mexicana]|uniref:peptidase M24, structural domain-containing protein n=1 Tax=Zychaea mexicana TaxID=64656 RepID=UPI0022FE5E45|nr:peptidase M24, structural domain-containing protein [Zychaea mexicana]KAI9490854.1 peptidase M24, structural domain-containing protein [Zychaea mexicana]
MPTTTCSSLGCKEAANLQCPTCLKQNVVEGSFFCSQDCFKKSWVIQAKKDLFTSLSSILTMLFCCQSGAKYDPFSTFGYTGKLRPVYPLSPRRQIPEHIERPEYAETGIPKTEFTPIRNKIRVLSPEEIQATREACRITREVLETAAAAVRVGVTTDEIDRIVHEATIERGAYPSPLNYHYFPKSCCTSVNEVICHGIPDQRPLEDGDLLNIDISCFYNGFHGDANATYLVGDNVNPVAKKLVQVTRECLEKSIAAVKPGMRYRDFGKIIEDHATANGFSVVRAFCGHGINQLFHCAPDVPHYANNKAVGILKPGHIFTIEPMLCEGVYDDLLWPDGWTATTKDGKLSAQFEHTMLVTETGVEVLT